MLLAQWPVTVLMQRQMRGQRWPEQHWSAVAVLPAGYGHAEIEGARSGLNCAHYAVPGLLLELHSDELAGYFENWVAPAPRVFVRWQMQDGRAMPIQVSVSYAEGARMLDAGDGADGVPMPPALHAWLGASLVQHPPPDTRPHRGPRRERSGPEGAPDDSSPRDLPRAPTGGPIGPIVPHRLPPRPA